MIILLLWHLVQFNYNRNIFLFFILNIIFNAMMNNGFCNTFELLSLFMVLFEGKGSFLAQKQCYFWLFFFLFSFFHFSLRQYLLRLLLWFLFC